MSRMSRHEETSQRTIYGIGVGIVVGLLIATTILVAVPSCLCVGITFLGMNAPNTFPRHDDTKATSRR